MVSAAVWVCAAIGRALREADRYERKSEKEISVLDLPVWCIYGLANHAGEGYLTTAQRDLVYYTLQIFVILGYLLYSLFFRFCAGKRIRSAVAYSVFGIFLACVILMFAAGRDSLLNVIVSMIGALCLGGIGGAAHHRMSLETVMGADVAQCMGLGSAAAVVLQYLLQIRVSVTPLLPVFMLAAFLLFLFILRRKAPEAVMEGDRKQEKTPPGRIVFSILIAATFLLFACFYNEYIHHLQIQSDYASYNVYSWPSLMLVPGYLLFAVVGDRKNGKYVPFLLLYRCRYLQLPADFLAPGAGYKASGVMGHRSHPSLRASGPGSSWHRYSRNRPGHLDDGDQSRSQPDRSNGRTGDRLAPS